MREHKVKRGNDSSVVGLPEKLLELVVIVISDPAELVIVEQVLDIDDDEEPRRLRRHITFDQATRAKRLETICTRGSNALSLE